MPPVDFPPSQVRFRRMNLNAVRAHNEPKRLRFLGFNKFAQLIVLEALAQCKPPFHVLLLSVDPIRRKDGLQKNLHLIEANTQSD